MNELLCSRIYILHYLNNLVEKKNVYVRIGRKIKDVCNIRSFYSVMVVKVLHYIHSVGGFNDQ